MRKLIEQYIGKNGEIVNEIELTDECVLCGKCTGTPRECDFIHPYYCKECLDDLQETN